MRGVRRVVRQPFSIAQESPGGTCVAGSRQLRMELPSNSRTHPDFISSGLRTLSAGNATPIPRVTKRIVIYILKVMFILHIMQYLLT